MKLVGLWRYPVKSLQGERLESAVVAQDGLLCDPLWGQRDELTAILEPAVLYDAMHQFGWQARDDVREVRGVQNPNEQRARMAKYRGWFSTRKRPPQ